MRLLDIYAGGPGSGCNPEVGKCGRPSMGMKYSPETKSWHTQGGERMPDHIKNLKVPPGWNNVAYHPDPNSDLHVTGKDSKGRTQAIYSAKFMKQQADAKFARIDELNGKLNQIATKVHSDAQGGNEEAAALRLVMATGVRPGGEGDTGATKQAYGATTLEGRHVFIGKNGNVRLRFVGKKGVKINIPVDHPNIAQDLVDRKTAAGDKGKIFNTSAGKLLDYTHQQDGGGFKTKDFRTLLATKTANEQVAAMKPPKNEKDYKKAVNKVADIVAEKLGNTRTVALQSYIHPVVFHSWRMHMNDGAGK